MLNFATHVYEQREEECLTPVHESTRREEELATGCEELRWRQSSAGIRYSKTNWSAAMRVSHTSTTRPAVVRASRIR